LRICSYTTIYISETVKITVECEQEALGILSNGVIFNDLE